LSSTAVFSRNDKITDSERFYNSIVSFLEDPEEEMDVKKLLVWWDRWVLLSIVTVLSKLEPGRYFQRVIPHRAPFQLTSQCTPRSRKSEERRGKFVRTSVIYLEAPNLIDRTAVAERQARLLLSL
jgi:hypothetical protein